MKETRSYGLDGGHLSPRFEAEVYEKNGAAWSDGGPLRIAESAPQTLTEALLETARREPGHGIYFVEDESLRADFVSYAELLREARTILGGLQAKGLGRGARAILQLESLRDHFAAFWACALGGITPVTVAIAPSYRERNGVVNKLLNTWALLEKPVVLTNARLQPSLEGLVERFQAEGLRSFAVEELKATTDGHGRTQAGEILAAQPEDVVFYQLTSGSTGIPKCIQETHRGIIHHIHGAAIFNGYGRENIDLNWLPVDHVVPILTCHLKDVYLGCSQVQVKTNLVLADPLRWLDLLERFKATHTWSPNFGFKLVADRLSHAPERSWDLSRVQFMMNAGEQVTLPVVAEFLERTAPFGIRPEVMQPAFGMAEVCTCMTYQNRFAPATGAHRVLKRSLRGLLEAGPEGGESTTFVDLGPPVPGVQIRIVDGENQLLPEGVIGRLQIKGAVVTPGYLKNEKANQEAFVGEGWFNSGDLGFIKKGRLTLTGREKEMIIVRGANFYCYEIEDVVNSVPGVEPTFTGSCAVVDHREGTEGLAIFFVPAERLKNEGALGELVSSIKARVASNLGIQPLAVIPLEKKNFPKTTSGKIQRSQLKKSFEEGEFDEIQKTIAKQERVGTRALTEREQLVAGIWREALGRDEIGPEENFFAVGGDSLRAAQILARFREKLGIELTWGELFDEAATIEGAARLLERRSSSTEARAIPRVEDRRQAPLTPAQEAVWVMEQINATPGLFNIAFEARIAGMLDRAALEKTLRQIVRRHAPLRAVLKLREGMLIQEFAECENDDFYAVERIDASNSPTAHLKVKDGDLSRLRHPHPDPLPVGEGMNEGVQGQLETLQERVLEESQRVFDLEKGPLFRARLFRLNPADHRLVLVFHQLIADGWSFKRFFGELRQLYEWHAHNRGGGLEPLPVEYVDFAGWKRQLASGPAGREHLAYWREQLKGAPGALSLPFDFLLPSSRIFDGQSFRRSLSEELTQRIKAAAQREKATVFMTMLAAWQALLHGFTGAEDIVTGSSLAGREHSELEPMIGFCVNTVALRGKVKAETTFRELIQAARATVIQAATHQEAPFSRVLQELQVAPDGPRPPVFQVWFSSWEPTPAFETGDIKWVVERIPIPAAQFELSLFLIDHGSSLELVWEHNSRLFKTETVSRFAAAFEDLLDAASRDVSSPVSKLAAGLERLKGGASRATSGEAAGRSSPGPDPKRMRRRVVSVSESTEQLPQQMA